MNEKAVNIAECRKERERSKYKRLVLNVFDRMTREEKREFLEKRAAVEREARRRL